MTGETLDRAARVLVVYYSATGHVHALAKAVAEGAEQVGADVRLRHVEELAPEMLISQNQAWGRHRSEVSDEPTASLGDLEWADGIAFGTPIAPPQGPGPGPSCGTTTPASTSSSPRSWAEAIACATRASRRPCDTATAIVSGSGGPTRVPLVNDAP